MYHMKTKYKKYLLLSYINYPDGAQDEVSVWKWDGNNYKRIKIIKGDEENFLSYMVLDEGDPYGKDSEVYYYSDNLDEVMERAMLEIL